MSFGIQGQPGLYHEYEVHQSYIKEECLRQYQRLLQKAYVLALKRFWGHRTPSHPPRAQAVLQKANGHMWKKSPIQAAAQCVPECPRSSPGRNIFQRDTQREERALWIWALWIYHVEK